MVASIARADRRVSNQTIGVTGPGASSVRTTDSLGHMSYGIHDHPGRSWTTVVAKVTSSRHTQDVSTWDWVLYLAEVHRTG